MDSDSFVDHSLKTAKLVYMKKKTALKLYTEVVVWKVLLHCRLSNKSYTIFKNQDSNLKTIFKKYIHKN